MVFPEEMERDHRHTLLEESPPQVIQTLPRASRQLLELLKQRTNRSRHLG